MRALDMLYRTTEKVGKMLDTYLHQDTLDRQNDFLNLIKMVMYLVITSVRAIDTFMKKNCQEPTGGRKNKKNSVDQTAFGAAYEVKRYEVLMQVCNIMQLPIEKLWNMSIVEEDFVK